MYLGLEFVKSKEIHKLGVRVNTCVLKTVEKFYFEHHFELHATSFSCDI